ANRVTSEANPWTRSDVARRRQISQALVNTIIKNYTDAKKREKTRVHRLTEAHKQNRKTNFRKLYKQHFRGHRSECAVELDVSVIDKVMAVSAMTGRDVLPLIEVPDNAKIITAYYVDNVLKHINEDGGAKLYGEIALKVFLRHDSAISRTTRYRKPYAGELNTKTSITFIANADIPVKSPNAISMDIFGFGHLKQALWKTKVSIPNWLWKRIREEWNNVTPEKCSDTLDFVIKCFIISDTNNFCISIVEPHLEGKLFTSHHPFHEYELDIEGLVGAITAVSKVKESWES
ncbi:unnamed protein product, partial [Allacma fusca]